MADWLPKSYILNQVTILALGLWAIIHRGSVIQVELVCFSIYIFEYSLLL
jgi:hypothetical protein